MSYSEVFKYISDSRITKGGITIPPEGLTLLDKRTLKLAIDQKVIKKVKANVSKKRSTRKGIDTGDAGG